MVNLQYVELVISEGLVCCEFIPVVSTVLWKTPILKP